MTLTQRAVRTVFAAHWVAHRLITQRWTIRSVPFATGYCQAPDSDFCLLCQRPIMLAVIMTRLQPNEHPCKGKSHSKRFFFSLPVSRGDAMEDADASCHTRKRCCLPWECLFDLTGVHCPRDVCVDGTVYRRHAGCRKQHFAAPAAWQGLFTGGFFFPLLRSKVNYYCSSFMLREHLISYRMYFSQWRIFMAALLLWMLFFFCMLWTY